MKQQLFILLLTALVVNSNAQIDFEKGYFIDNNGKKTTCLIHNFDWKDNPTSFEYKLSEDSEKERADIKSVTEFSVDNFSKYIRRTVEVDMSVYEGEADRLEEGKDPVFVTKQLFLKTLIEGKANLFLYQKGSVKKFFYNGNSAEVKQLVYRRYVIFNSLENKGNLIRYNTDNIKENNLFKQQLWADFEEYTDVFKIQKLEYNQKSLTNFFVSCNQISKLDFIDYKLLERKDGFNLTLRPRYNYSSLKLNYGNDLLGNFDFGFQSEFGFGIELEFVLPFRKGKWTIPIEPTYQRFKTGESFINRFGGRVTADINYQSIEVPLGARRYFFITEKSKAFVNGFLVLDFNRLESSVTMRSVSGFVIDRFKPQALANLAFGVGYKHNIYSVEMRYLSNRNIALRNQFLNTYYETISVVLGVMIR